MIQRFFDQAGRQISITKKLGDGAEGAVFDIAGSPDTVAKVYHAARRPEKANAAKLVAMVALTSNDILQAAAWPVGTLHESPGGPLVGLLMRKAAGRELHDLYGTQSRRQFFPDADWRFLVRVARNVAAAVDALHRQGIILGDVNQRNINVGPDATVRLTDCDSFQIRRYGHTWRCEVGVPHFTPPELLGERFDQIDRTVEHDRFGLAVLIFYLLAVGYHPFMGRYPGRAEALKIEEAIKGYVFPYGRNAAKFGAEPPKGAPRLSDFPPDIAALFERAFNQSQQQPHRRPSASDWYSSLAKLESNIRSCPDDAGHHFANHLTDCPWCRIENDGGASFFLTVTMARGGSASGIRFDLSAVWARIESVSPPKPPEQLPAGQSHVVARALPSSIGDHRMMRQVIAGIAIASVLVILIPQLMPFGMALSGVFGVWWLALFFTSPLRHEQAARSKRLARCRETMKRVISERDDVYNSSQRRFNEGLSVLRNLRLQYETLPDLQRRELDRLATQARERQLQQFLERHVIWHANVPNIGPKRAAVLATYGIETAADVDAARILSIDGFGPSLATDLVVWRSSLESRFRFDSRQGVPKADQDALAVRLRKQATQLERSLTRGEASLRAIIADYDRRLGEVNIAIATVRAECEQAHADLKIAMNA